ncbi:MAG: hypothetical protein ACHQYQ_00240 [Bacteriovoracales bacterium]
MEKLLIISLLFYSCASNYRPPESFGDKMGRYSSKSKHYNIVPKSYAMDTNYKSMGRKIASKEEGKKMMGYTNSSLYFLSLFSQFKQIQKLSEKQAGTLKRCPRFHGEFLQVEENHINFPEGKIDYSIFDKNLLYDENYLAKNPALLLPLSESSNAQIVRDKLEGSDLSKINQIVEDALLVQQIKILNELQELCEDGVSDNFYAYQNLLIYADAKKDLTPSKKSMETLLKVSLFFNRTLIESLKANSKLSARSISSVKEADAIDNQLLYRMKADWADDYLKNIKKNK